MKSNFKTIIFNFIVFFLIFISFWFFSTLIFPNFEGAIKAGLIGGLTALFSPRIKRKETQIGTKLELIWIFYKKPFSF
jgi:hypothetical protein